MNNPHQAQTHSPGKMFAGKKRTLVFALFCAIFCFSLAVCAAEEKPLLLTGGVQDNGPAPAARMPVAAPEISAEAGNFLEALQNANRAVAAAVLPSVATLDVFETRTVESSPLDGFPWFFFGRPDGNREDAPGRAREYEAEGLGSGVIIRREGNTYYLLTNHHVAGTASRIRVKLYDGREFSGTLIGGDERKDIALVSFESDDTSIAVARMGDSDLVQPGDIVFAVGSPLGYVSSLTQGVVSAVGRNGGPNGNINDFIQTDAAINQGNSGGPLVNIRGEVIGINSWIASSSGGSMGLGFSIPINNVKQAIDDFIAGGKINYGWLGVQLLQADREILESMGLENVTGALASQVFLGSPADKGGFLPGDYVTALNGEAVRSVDQLVRDVGDLRSGDTAEFTVLRGGETLTLTVRIDARDEELVADSSNLWPGFLPYELTGELRERLDLRANQKGVLVTNVMPKSPAAVMGLQSGDVVVQVNDHSVNSLTEFYAQLAGIPSGKEVWFTVLREGHELSTIRFRR